MGVLQGITVLDLSWGVAGPSTTMLLADHGAAVTRIERPGDDPFADHLDYRVWHRGKRSAVLDLQDPADRARFVALAATADVVVESFAPGVAARLGVDHASLAARNPRLITCSITGYGPRSRFADRPAYDQLVAARTGYQWEVRAWPGTAAQNAAGEDLFGPDTEIPAIERHWFARRGPVFTATPAPSISAAYLATLGISAALRAREHTGVGQHVETSLVQGIIAYQGSMWQRSEHPPASPAQGAIMQSGPGVTINSGPWSLYECADGKWINQWTSRPEWAIVAAEGDELRLPDPEKLAAFLAETGGRDGSLERQLTTRLLAKPAFKKFTQAQWVALAAEAMVALQPVRAPEEVLTDPALVATGAVVEVDDHDLGPLRQPGILYRMSATPGAVRGPAPRRGADTDAVRAEADALVAAAAPATVPAAGTGRTMRGPLDGVRVIDFGLAVAGPWCGELLAQLGADVVKVDPPKQNWWLSTHMAMKVNRSKRHLSLDAKTPEGAEIARELVRGADVVLMNIRPQAARKLSLDYDSLRAINPALVYCRTAGFDPTRSHLPGNDQTGNAVGGSEWEDGGMARGGRPYWSAASGGDLGNGYLAAIGIVQALLHRDRTGEGQEIDTNIMNASMFSSGRVYTTPDGTRLERPTVDPELFGFDAGYRLYECADGWLCIAAFGDAAWSQLASVIPDLGEARIASASARAAHDAELIAVIGAFLRDRPVAEAFALLDGAGVPCEISDLEFSNGVLDDPELRANEWFVERPGQRVHGSMVMFGRVIDFSGTPTEILGPPAVPGEHTREILAELGHDADDIGRLLAAKAVFDAS